MFKLKVIGWLLGIGAVLMTAFVSLYLQELAKDEIPALCKEKGVRVPLTDPRIVVDLSRFTLTLYEGETEIKRYDIGFGKAQTHGIGTLEGSTPVGEYRIVRKALREDVLERGSRFLQIDYPSPDDAFAAYRAGSIDSNEYKRIEAAAENRVPPPADTPLRGDIGIQGNFFLFRDRHYTDGSIGLSNADINELFEYVNVDTPVIITKST